jgi:hypothetical protein
MGELVDLESLLQQLDLQEERRSASSLLFQVWHRAHSGVTDLLVGIPVGFLPVFAVEYSVYILGYIALGVKQC